MFLTSPATSGWQIPLFATALFLFVGAASAQPASTEEEYSRPLLDVPYVPTSEETVHRMLELADVRSEEHTSELQSRPHLVCRLLLEKKNKHIMNLAT